MLNNTVSEICNLNASSRTGILFKTEFDIIKAMAGEMSKVL